MHTTHPYPLPSNLADHLDHVLTGTAHRADDILAALADPNTSASDDALLSAIRDGYTTTAPTIGDQS